VLTEPQFRLTIRDAGDGDIRADLPWGDKLRNLGVSPWFLEGNWRYDCRWSTLFDSLKLRDVTETSRAAADPIDQHKLTMGCEFFRPIGRHVHGMMKCALDVASDVPPPLASAQATALVERGRLLPELASRDGYADSGHTEHGWTSTTADPVVSVFV
jgi:hypothetical protein